MNRIVDFFETLIAQSPAGSLVAFRAQSIDHSGGGGSCASGSSSPLLYPSPRAATYFSMPIMKERPGRTTTVGPAPYPWIVLDGPRSLEWENPLTAIAESSPGRLQAYLPVKEPLVDAHPTESLNRLLAAYTAMTRHPTGQNLRDGGSPTANHQCCAGGAETGSSR